MTDLNLNVILTALIVPSLIFVGVESDQYSGGYAGGGPGYAAGQGGYAGGQGGFTGGQGGFTGGQGGYNGAQQQSYYNNGAGGQYGHPVGGGGGAPPQQFPPYYDPNAYQQSTHNPHQQSGQHQAPYHQTHMSGYNPTVGMPNPQSGYPSGPSYGQQGWGTGPPVQNGYAPNYTGGVQGPPQPIPHGGGVPNVDQNDAAFNALVRLVNSNRSLRTHLVNIDLMLEKAVRGWFLAESYLGGSDTCRDLATGYFGSPLTAVIEVADKEFHNTQYTEYVRKVYPHQGPFSQDKPTGEVGGQNAGNQSGGFQTSGVSTVRNRYERFLTNPADGGISRENEVIQSPVGDE